MTGLTKQGGKTPAERFYEKFGDVSTIDSQEFDEWVGNEIQKAEAEELENSSRGKLSQNPSIIVAALLFTLTVLATNGLGGPLNGLQAGLVNADNNFDKALQALNSAIPDAAQWSGSAADAFTAQINVIADQVLAVKEEDLGLKDVIDDHADNVQRTRASLAVVITFLYAALAMSSVTNVATTIPFQLVVAAAALTADATIIGLIVNQSCTHKTDANQRKTKYQQAKLASEFNSTTAVDVAVPSAQANIIGNGAGTSTSASQILHTTAPNPASGGSSPHNSAASHAATTPASKSPNIRGDDYENTWSTTGLAASTSTSEPAKTAVNTASSSAASPTRERTKTAMAENNSENTANQELQAAAGNSSESHRVPLNTKLNTTDDESSPTTASHT